MISTITLEKDLGRRGFVVAYRDDVAGEMVFVRNRSREAFDRIRLNFSDGGKAASVGVEVSIVPGRTALKSLCIHRCLTELATDARRGITRLPNDESIRSLFARIGDVAPRECEKLAREELNDLLHETAPARDAAAKYLELIEALGADQIAKRVSPEAQKEVDRILQQRFVCIPGGERYYTLAIKAIAVGCGQVEGDDEWLVGRDADAWEDRELMIRLQVIASRLAQERGWDLHVAS